MPLDPSLIAEIAALIEARQGRQAPPAPPKPTVRELWELRRPTGAGAAAAGRAPLDNRGLGRLRTFARAHPELPVDDASPGVHADRDGDEAAVRRFFESLSLESRAKRFMTGAVDLAKAAAVTTASASATAPSPPFPKPSWTTTVSAPAFSASSRTSAISRGLSVGKLLTVTTHGNP